MHRRSGMRAPAIFAIALSVFFTLAACGDNITPGLEVNPLPPQMPALHRVTWTQPGQSSSIGEVACGDTISHPCPWLLFTDGLEIDDSTIGRTGSGQGTLRWYGSGGVDANGNPAEHRNPVVESYQSVSGAIVLAQVGDDAGLRLATTLAVTPSGWAGDVSWDLFAIAGATTWHVEIVE